MSRVMVRWLVIGAIAIALLAGAVGALMAVWLSGSRATDEAMAEQVSDTPGLDYIDAFTCPPGLIREVQMHGVEDNFDRAGDEPATPRAALLEYATFKQMHSGELPNGRQFRNYDERGMNKLLLDSFEIEPGVVSGEVILKVMPAGENGNDSVSIGTRMADHLLDEFNRDFGYIIVKDGGVKNKTGLDGLIIRNFSELEQEVIQSAPPTLVDYLNRKDRPFALDFSVSDDTVVDFAAFLICREPRSARGTAFSAAHAPLPVSGLTYMACGWDPVMPLCQPHSGHIQCSKPTPIACYKDGKAKPPRVSGPEKVSLEIFVPGEVRLSEPVRAVQFATLGEASAYCEGSFGKGWRVLSFHEGGGTAITTKSKIEPLASGLVHVADRPYGNCWDRPESVIAR